MSDAHFYQHAVDCGIDMTGKKAVAATLDATGCTLAVAVLHPETQETFINEGTVLSAGLIGDALRIGVDYFIVEAFDPTRDEYPLAEAHTVYTSQSAFDAVLQHIRQQRVAARDVDSNCVYRATLTNGKVLKCAFGALIPDDLYSAEFENKTAGQLLRRSEMVLASVSDDTRDKAERLSRLFADVDPDLVQELQDAHDTDLARGLAAWEDMMESIARRFGLTYTPVTA